VQQQQRLLLQERTLAAPWHSNQRNSLATVAEDRGRVSLCHYSQHSFLQGVVAACCLGSRSSWQILTLK
jgi:hypothetical protein